MCGLGGEVAWDRAWVPETRSRDNLVLVDEPSEQIARSGRRRILADNANLPLRCQRPAY